MTRDRNDKRRLVSSVLDRLIDDPNASGEPPRSSGQHLSQLKRSVTRDLENLLNTRRRWKEFPPESRDLEGSLINYGIPDFTGLNMSVPSERERTRAEIERVIRRFEPRLKNVVVTIEANADAFERTLRFRITGVLRTEPLPERVVFDSELKPATAEIEVKVVP
jgi:type VI secretion system protein ImpF